MLTALIHRLGTAPAAALAALALAAPTAAGAPPRGVKLVKAIEPYNPIALDGTLLFGVSAGSARTPGLWRTDGTGTGTKLVAKDRYFQPRTVARGVTYFESYAPDTGFELWRTDGTRRGTRLLQDATPGAESSLLDGFAAMNGTVFFTADAPGRHRPELWRTDGTPAGTLRVGDMDIGIARAASLGGALLFAGSGGGLWRSDGTARNTVLVRGGGRPERLTVVRQTLFFFDGWALWRSDGSADGTRLVADVDPHYVPSSEEDLAPFISDFIATGNRLFFTVEDAGGTKALWVSDGTTAGTGQLGSPSHMRQFTAVGNTLYFTARDDLHGRELWRSDGTAGGTVLVSDLAPGAQDSRIDQLTAVGRTLFFVTRSNPGQLWRTTPRPERVRLVWRLENPSGFFGRYLTAMAGSLFLSADRDGMNAFGLYKTRP